MQQADRIITGEAVALDIELANVGSRGVAALIDLAVILVIQVVLLVPIILLGPGNIDAATAVLILIELLVFLGYPVAMETLWRGRTLGKAAMGLRVVRDDGGPIGFRQAFVRGLVGVTVDKPGITYALGALIPISLTKQRKRLGDMAAGTLVVQERVPGRLDAPVTMPAALAGWAASLDLSGVDDDLAMRLRQFISRAGQLTPEARAGLEHQLANEVVGRVGPPPPQAPAWAVITAVLAERRRRAVDASQPTSPPLYSPPTWEPAVPTAPAVSDTPTGFTPPS